MDRIFVVTRDGQLVRAFASSHEAESFSEELVGLYGRRIPSYEVVEVGFDTHPTSFLEPSEPDNSLHHDPPHTLPAGSKRLRAGYVRSNTGWVPASVEGMNKHIRRMEREARLRAIEVRLEELEKPKSIQNPQMVGGAVGYFR